MLLLLGCSRDKISTLKGLGFNTKAKLTTRKAYGFRTYHAAEIALYHALGALPVPKVTHEFF
jgi:transposase